jgi:hypothetical protein
MVRQANWIAINEITHKFDYKGRAIAYAMHKSATEAWIKREPFEKREGERSWRGDCMGLL